jgi:hemolysin activation/secretion protein
VALAHETLAALAMHATPATGRYRVNDVPAAGNQTTLSVTVRRRSEGFAVRRDVAGEATAEVGEHFARFNGNGHLLVPLGSTRLLARAQFGIATRDLPPYRVFVLGGRGTLLGDPFREWGGRRMALVHVEWRTTVPFLRLSSGPARTPGTITLAPFVATGWAAEPVPLSPWRATAGTRVTLGLGAEWLGVFRLDAGYGVQSRRLQIAFDVTRDFWDIM